MRKLLLFVLLLCACKAADAAQTALYFKSDPGDYIGAGQTQYYTSEQLTFTVSKSGGAVGFAMTNFSISPYVWWYLYLAAPNFGILTPGDYKNAARWPFEISPQPGLSFFGDGRGCNTLTGSFQVLEVTYGSGGAVVSFAADFVQHCEGWTPALYGSIRYNSDVPISAILPAKITLENPLNLGHCVEATGPSGAVITVDGLKSRDSIGGTNLKYAWVTTTGRTGTGPLFSFDAGLNQQVSVQLTITDNYTSKQSTASFPVCVSDTTPPRVVILSPKNGEVIPGNSLQLEVAITDLVDKNINHYDFSVGFSGNAPLDPQSGISRVVLPQLTGGPGVKSPESTTIQVTASDASGNVGKATVAVTRK